MVKQPEHLDTLAEAVGALGAQVVAEAVGLNRVPSTPAKLRVQTLHHRSIHPVGVVHVTSDDAGAQLFAKAKRANYIGPQNLRNEMQFLSEVAPLIAAENPTLRSPRPIGYYPERELLLMEYVRGKSLKFHLFDFTWTNTRRLAQVLRLSGEWLGKLHKLTLKDTQSNPLKWLHQEFVSLRTKQAFLCYASKDSYDELLSILQRSIEQNPEFKRNQCTIHGDFTPIHVLVGDQASYVVDFGNTEVGFPYQDVGRFATFFDCVLPWRAEVGTMKIALSTQQELFLNGYFAEAPFAFRPADDAIMRWVRLLSFVRFWVAGRAK